MMALQQKKPSPSHGMIGNTRVSSTHFGLLECTGTLSGGQVSPCGCQLVITHKSARPREAGLLDECADLWVITGVPGLASRQEKMRSQEIASCWTMGQWRCMC